jgi:hypothetical protein
MVRLVCVCVCVCVCLCACMCACACVCDENDQHNSKIIDIMFTELLKLHKLPSVHNGFYNLCIAFEDNMFWDNIINHNVMLIYRLSLPSYNCLKFRDETTVSNHIQNMELAVTWQPCGICMQLQAVRIIGQHYADQQVHAFIAQCKVKCGIIQ